MQKLQYILLQNKISDEFVPPTLIGKEHSIQDGDAVLFFNFRADRARQLTSTFLDPSFKGFERKTLPKLSYFVSMTQYDKNLLTTTAFPPVPLNNTLGEVLSSHGLSQLRIAETEKYAHVTFSLMADVKVFLQMKNVSWYPLPKWQLMICNQK